jgi:hypothetical protein
MRLAKFSVFTTALIYLIIGLMFLIAPLYFIGGIDILLPTPTAIIDLQATYGGCMLSIGIFLLYCLKNQVLFKTGLIFQALSLSGFAFGRILGLIIYGFPKPIIFYLLVAEISGVILAIYCLWQIGKTDKI